MSAELVPYDALRSALELPFHEALTATALELPTSLKVEEWRQIGHAFGRLNQSMQWWVGDWWAFGEARYGDRKGLVEAEDWDGPAFQACMNAASVCRKFEASRRREALSFAHHAEVAALSPDMADKLLDWAEASIRETGRPQSASALREQARKARVRKAQASLPQGWTADQLDRRARAEAGECVVATLREVDGHRVDDALLNWAEAEDRAVRIDRQSEFGNPFVMPDDGDREEVIAYFEKFYWPYKRGLLAKIADWRGKVLICWCHPEPCHGDTIAETINAVARGEGTPQEVADSIADFDG